MIELVYRTSQAKSVGNPLRTIPATYPFDEEWCELRQDHSRPVVTISLSIFEEFFYGFQLLVRGRYANHIVIFFGFRELFPADAGRPKGRNAYAGLVRHDQFCVRVPTLSCPANNPVVPASLTLIKGYTKLLWFCRLNYPIVL